MKIDRRLNIALEVERGDGTSIHVHSIPIPKEVYDVHWSVIHDTINEIYMRRYLPPMAVRVGMKFLLDVAIRHGVKEAVERDLLPHIWRLTTLIVPGQGTIPFEVAMKNGPLDADDIEEVQQYLVYFTLASWVHPKKELGRLLYPALTDSGALLGAWTSMEFVTSLQTLKKDDNTGESTPALSVPH